MTAPTPRVGGRVLLIDPDDRVLLIHERIDDGTTHWLTPGGGLEAGEKPPAAAARESFEETGLHIEIPPDAEPVLVTQRLWSWAGVTYDQTDHFFAVRVARDLALRPAALTPMEQQTALGYGWWSVAELRASDEVIVPAELADVLADAARRLAS